MSTVISIADKHDIGWRVKQCLAENRGYDAEELHADYRLRADLHLDGDNAVEFFEIYGREFHVDLSELKACWEFFFQPQNTWLSKPVKLALAVAVSAGLLEWALFPHFSAIAGFVTVFGIFIVILLSVQIAQRLNGERDKPEHQEITIGDLIEAAGTGTWKVSEEIQEWVSKQESFRRLT
jgi:Protein of unknown function (DUF1493)